MAINTGQLPTQFPSQAVSDEVKMSENMVYLYLELLSKIGLIETMDLECIFKLEMNFIG